MDALWHAYPHALIEASGSHVGLPDHQMGNSEVGHLTIGSRIIRQELVRISDTVRSNQLGDTQALRDWLNAPKSEAGPCTCLAFAPMGASTAMWTICVG